MPQPEETFEDLLQSLGSEHEMLRKCDAAGVLRSSLRRLRAGTGHVTEVGTIHTLAALLGVPVARVDRALTVRRRRSPRQF